MIYSLIMSLLLLGAFLHKRVVRFSETHLVITSILVLVMSSGAQSPPLVVWGTVIPLVYIVVKVALWIYSIIPPSILAYSGFLLAYVLEFDNPILGMHISDLVLSSILVVIGMYLNKRRKVLGILYLPIAIAVFLILLHYRENGVMTLDTILSVFIFAIALLVMGMDRVVLVYNNKFDLIYVKSINRCYLHKVIDIDDEQMYLIENADKLLRFTEETMQMGSKKLEISDHQQKITIFSQSPSMFSIIVSSGGHHNHQKAMRRLTSITDRVLREGNIKEHLDRMALIDQ